MTRVCWRPLLVVISLASSLLLAASNPPSNVIRFDYGFWNMLTPAGRDRLMAVPVIIRESCEGVLQGTVFTGGVYDGLADTITLCDVNIPEERDRIRHEALHALDWTFGFRMTDKNGFGKAVPPALYEEAERAYRCNAQGGCHGWFRQGEAFAMIPIVVGWDFDALPAQVARYYSVWFEEAR